MTQFFLWATLGLVPFVTAVNGSPHAGCPQCSCCGCCETGTCRCATCGCACCEDECPPAGGHAGREGSCRANRCGGR